MKKTNYISLILLLSVNMLIGQIEIFPYQGLSNIDIKIDSTRIDQNLTEDYALIENKYWDRWVNQDSTVVLYTQHYDKTKIVRSIEYLAENELKIDSNTIVIGKTTLEEFKKLYSKYYINSGSEEVEISLNGVEYYFKKSKLSKKAILKRLIVHTNNRVLNDLTDFELDYDILRIEIDSIVSLLNERIEKEDELSAYINNLEEDSPISISEELSRNISPELLQYIVRFRVLNSLMMVNLVFELGSQEVIYSYFGDENVIFHEEIEDKSNKHIHPINGRELSKQDFNELNYIKEFGFYCGIAASPPKLCYEMLMAINDEDEEKLLNWLESFNPEKSAYGYVGLKFLEIRRHRINAEGYQEKMRNVEKRNSILYSCSGCSFSWYKRFFEYITTHNLVNHEKYFRESGWLDEI